MTAELTYSCDWRLSVPLRFVGKERELVIPVAARWCGVYINTSGKREFVGGGGQIL